MAFARTIGIGCMVRAAPHVIRAAHPAAALGYRMPRAEQKYKFWRAMTRNAQPLRLRNEEHYTADLSLSA
jgi:hypothetical protein